MLAVVNFKRLIEHRSKCRRETKCVIPQNHNETQTKQSSHTCVRVCVLTCKSGIVRCCGVHWGHWDGNICSTLFVCTCRTANHIVMSAAKLVATTKTATSTCTIHPQTHEHLHIHKKICICALVNCFQTDSETMQH